MRFRSFEANNLFSLDTAQLSLDRRGLVLVTGHSEDEGGANGAGKSSLSSKGILYTLFGRTAGGLKADRVVNRHTGRKKAWGKLVFEVGGRLYEVVRQRGPNKLRLTVDGQDLSARQERETQVEIENLLGRSFKTFLQSEYFGQGRTMSYAELTPKGQKEVLEEILPLDRLSRAAEYTKAQLQEVSATQAEVAREVRDLEVRIETLTHYLHDASEKERLWRQEHGQETTNLLRKIYDAEYHPDEVAALDPGTLRQRVGEFRRSVGDWGRYVASLNARIQPVERTACPTCHQPMPEDTFERLRKEQERLAQEKAQAQATLAEAEASLSKLELELELTFVWAQLQQHRAQENPYRISGDMAGEVEERKKALAEAQARLEVLNQEVDHLTFWRNAFTRDLRLALFQAACPFLAERTRHHLAGLGNAQIHVEFATVKQLASGEMKEEFAVNVWSETGGESFDALSGGEQQLVSFAIGLALADLAAAQATERSSFLILDEPFAQLDDRNSEAIVHYLTHGLARERETILLISNEEHLKSLVPNRVHVVKKGGVSRVQ